MKAMLTVNPETRITAQELLKDNWFQIDSRSKLISLLSKFASACKITHRNQEEAADTAEGQALQGRPSMTSSPRSGAHKNSGAKQDRFRLRGGVRHDWGPHAAHTPAALSCLDSTAVVTRRESRDETRKQFKARMLERLPQKKTTRTTICIPGRAGT